MVELKMKSWINKNLVWLILGAFLLFDIIFRVSIALSVGITGDGAMHAMIAREIARNFRLQSHFPYFVTGQGTYYPVAYPQFFHVIMAVFYMVGGDTGIILLAPITGTLVVLAVFIFMRKFFGSTVALIASFLLIGERHLFVITIEPLMEGLVILLSILTIFEFLLYTSSGKKQNLLLSSLFLGLLLATKQQGFIISVVLAVFTLAFTIKKIYSKKVSPVQVLKKNVGSLFLLLGISLLIAAPFLYFQIQTTGTIDYPPATGITKLFLKPKWVEDSESVEWIAWRAGYNITPLHAILFLILIYYYSTVFSVFISILIILGFMYMILRKEYHDFLLLIISFIVVYFPTMLYMNTTWRYFSTLPVLSTMVAALGAYWVVKKLAYTNFLKTDLKSTLGSTKGMRKHKFTIVLVTSFLILFLIIPTFANIYANYMKGYKGSDRTTGGYWPDRMTKVREAAEWLNEHTTSTDIILVDRWNEVGYYSERNVLCINELGGHNIPKIYASNSSSEAIKYLREYNITYIWISQLQIDRSMYEWIPRHGLLDFIDFSPQYFRKVYQNDLIRIYKVLYPSGDSILSDKHYYSNVLGDFDDVYFISPIVVEPADKWLLNVSYGRELTSDGEPAYIRVYINQEELWVKGAKSQLRSNSPLTLVLYYWDTFTSNVYIDIHNGTEQYKEISSIDGNATERLRWKVIQIKNLEYSILSDESGYSYIKFRVRNTSSFTLQMALLVPEPMNITDNICEGWASWLLGEGGE
jgi:hypothetical protein